MKAITTLGNGSLDYTEVAAPTPTVDQVLIRVEAASVNPLEAHFRAGHLHAAGVIAHDRPIGLGWDVVGRVEQAAHGHAVGELVAAVVPAFDVPVGGLVELAAVPSGHVARVPDSVTAVEAAAVGMNALTARQAIALLGEAGGRTLLVTGAAGAVGGFALELLADQGWEVSGLARDDDAAFVTARGAKLVTDLDGSYDAVLDTAALQDAALAAVRPGGAFVGVQPSMPLEATEGRTVTAVSVTPDGAGLADLLERAGAGSLTVRVAGTVPFSKAAEAFDHVAAGGNRGRWVVVTD